MNCKFDKRGKCAWCGRQLPKSLWNKSVLAGCQALQPTSKKDSSWRQLSIQHHYLPNICGANKPPSERCEHLELLVACNGCGCGKPKLIGRPEKAKELGVGVLMDCPKWHIEKD